MELRTADLLEGERPLLERLIDRLTDVDHRDVYADWLEENGAPARARALRATSQFLRSGESKVLSGENSSSDALWQQLVGHEMLRAMAQVGLEREVCAEWLALGRVALGLEVRADTRRKWNVGESRMWGDPDLAPKEKWPTADECTFWSREKTRPPGIDAEATCKFVGQLEFAEFEPAISSRAFPARGLLSIFSFADFDSGSLGYTLRFADVPVRAPRAHPEGGEANSQTGAHSIIITEHLAFPEVSSVEGSLTERTRKALNAEFGSDVDSLLDDRRPTLHGLLGPLCNTSGTPRLPGPGWERLIVFKHDAKNPLRLHLAIESDAAKRGEFTSTHFSWADFG